MITASTVREGDLFSTPTTPAFVNDRTPMAILAILCASLSAGFLRRIIKKTNWEMKGPISAVETVAEPV